MKVTVAKFSGSVTNINSLNTDLCNNVSSEVMQWIKECNDNRPFEFFKINGNTVELIGIDEGTIDGHYEITNLYETLYPSDCDIISKHLSPGSKMVISFSGSGTVYYIIEHMKYECKSERDLF